MEHREQVTKKFLDGDYDFSSKVIKRRARTVGIKFHDTYFKCKEVNKDGDWQLFTNMFENLIEFLLECDITLQRTDNVHVRQAFTSRYRELKKELDELEGSLRKRDMI